MVFFPARRVVTLVSSRRSSGLIKFDKNPSIPGSSLFFSIKFGLKIASIAVGLVACVSRQFIGTNWFKSDDVSG